MPLLILSLDTKLLTKKFPKFPKIPKLFTTFGALHPRKRRNKPRLLRRGARVTWEAARNRSRGGRGLVVPGEKSPYYVLLRFTAQGCL